MKKKIIVLGATGSIGQSTLDIIEKCNDKFQVVGVSANSNKKKLSEICKKFGPNNVLFSDMNVQNNLQKSEFNGDEKFFFGNDLYQEFFDIDFDLVVNGISGFAGIKPTFVAIEKGKDIAIANKETIVSGGKLIIEKSKLSGSKIIPIDSEHNALFQLMKNYELHEIDKITLTASGGPFRGDTYKELSKRKYSEALNHPTWNMGTKNTIDSASLMNKGLEVIEASILFSLPSNKISVLVHPESIIHGIIHLIDGGIISYMSQPDMRVPIYNAMNFPYTFKHFLPNYEFGNLSFHNLNENIFPSIKIARFALEKGFIATNFFNAANEIAVESFIKDEINFTAIFSIVENVTKLSEPGDPKSIEDVFEYDKLARKYARNEVLKFSNDR